MERLPQTMMEQSPATPSTMWDESIDHAASKLFTAHAQTIFARTDRLFACLMVLQWIGALVLALTLSPQTWNGAASAIHPHVLMALIGGGLLTVLPVGLAWARPGRFSTRLVISVSQMLFSSLLIHVSGGRIETHFHIFVSLAFIASYRDWRVLLPATVVVAIDHAVRGMWWPESVFGIATASNLRWLEHTAWVLFEDIVLLLAIRQSVLEMRKLARHSAQLATTVRVAEESERRFRTSFDQAAVGMSQTCIGGVLQAMNDRFCDIVGYRREELLGRNFRDLVHPDDMELNDGLIQQLLRGEISEASTEKRYVHKLGHAVWVRTDVALGRDQDGQPSSLLAVAHDITEAKLAKEQLLRSHEVIRKLSLAVSRMRHSIIISDAHGKTEWANDAFTALTEYEVSEILGRPPGALLQGPDTDPETVALIRRRLDARQAVSTEILNYSKSGRPYWISLEIDPIFNDDGELINFVATQIEVTARREREAQLKQAMEHAESANQAKSQFLANMSHEIRTPLNGILGFADILLRDDQRIQPEERLDYLRTIRGSGQHLLALINDVLDLSKIEAGQLLVETIPCSPHQVIAETVSILRVRALEKGISLDYRWEGGVPESITTDPYRLKQLLMNLVGNAVKFTDEGSVLIVARVERDCDSHQLLVEVRDTGVGIPEDKLEAIFNPFVQADNSITRRYGGTGLGLAISRRIATALGGDLRASSIEGRGSTFTLRVAAGDLQGVRMLRQAPKTIGSDVRKASAAECQLTGKRILVVDDGEANRKLITLMLGRQGADVHVAENGKVAFETALLFAFDVILMDMQMPVMDGYTAAQRIRDQGFYGPIIALTAHAMEGDREKCERAGCSAYLSKPVDFDVLLRTVAECMTLPRYAPSSVPTTAGRAGETQPSEAIRSLLPTDDEAIRVIVEEFLDDLESKLAEMDAAYDRGDFEDLERLAHWLRGVGGTVGFRCFTEPASALEAEARLRDPAKTQTSLSTLRCLKQRITI